MFKRVKCYAVAGFAVSLITLAASAQGPATLTINVDKPVAKVSPTLYGLMTEEINYSYEAGLYGELVQDRNFMAKGDDTENWVPVEQGTGRGKLCA